MQKACLDVLEQISDADFGGKDEERLSSDGSSMKVMFLRCS